MSVTAIVLSFPGMRKNMRIQGKGFNIRRFNFDIASFGRVEGDKRQRRRGEEDSLGCHGQYRGGRVCKIGT